ncbi:MAG: CBS domain-containing protein [Gemmatimonadales bacterium]|nr:MAG: CBS domain-containing protein [Gemmatimonadales bacterium]
MESDLITVPPGTPVSELATLLDRAGITGAPVVDDEGVLLGIVTVRDVMRLAREATEVPEAARWGLGTLLSDEGVGSMDLPLEGEFFAYYVMPGGGFVDLRDRIRQLPESVFNGYQVADIMTSDPVTTPSSTRIRDLARLLVDRKIHRALVVDDGKLVGIVTSTDVLRAVAEG